MSLMRDHASESEGLGRGPGAFTNVSEVHGNDRIFVGRAREMADLRNHFDAMLSGGCRSLVIAGDAGIGKTRLASEFSLEARARNALVLWGRCWEAGGAPSFWPWIEVLRQTLAFDHLPRKLELGQHGAYVAELVPEFRDRLASLAGAPPTPKDPESARFLMFDAIGRVLRTLASRTPLVVVLDDLHVADRASLLLLTFLVRTLRDSRVLLIGTYRDPDAFLNPDVALLLAELGRQARRLSLVGLSPSDVCDLIQHAAGQTPADSLVSSIHRVTEGNPFFVDEVLQLLASEGRLISTDDSVAPFRIPDGVREAVRRRLDLVSDEQVRILEIAAVIGREFDATQVGLAAERTHLAVVEALFDPIRHGLVLEIAGAVGRFQFRHALVREVLYDDISAAHRLVLHRKVGEALETLSTTDPDRYIAELAHHFLLSAPCGIDARRVEYGTRAARRALARMAFEEAVILYQRTLDALPFAPPDERLQCEILLALGGAKEWANDAAGSREVFERAATIARRFGAYDLLVEAALGVGAIQALKFTATSRCESAPDLLSEALELIDPSDIRSRARILGRLSLRSLSIGERSEALERSAVAVAIARTCGDGVALGQVLTARHAVLYGPDSIDERLRISNELLQLGRQLKHRDFTIRGHALRFTSLFELGDIRQADIALRAHASLAEQVADPFEQWANLVWRAARILMEGRFDEASECARRAHDLAHEVPGLHATEHYAPITYAGQSILIEETRYGELPDPEIARHFRVRFPEISAWRVALLSGLTRAGDREAVRQELDSLDAHDFEDFERNGTWLASMSYLSEAIELVGDRRRASLVYELLRPFSDRNATISHIASRGSVSRALGLLAATMGSWREAEIHFESAIAMNRRMGARPHLATTLFDYGRLLSKHGGASSLEKATTLLMSALQIAKTIGMSGLINRCQLVQREISNTVERRVGSTSLQRHEGNQVWLLEHEGRRVYLKDSKGVTYIAALMQKPNHEIHAIDLVALFAPDGTRHNEPRDQKVVAIKGTGSSVADRLIDTRARRAYERRGTQLRAELADAETVGDPERVLAIRQEIDALRRELSRTVGLGNRIRRNSESERARISVTRAIRLAIAHVASNDAAMGRHLSVRIHTGTFCRYEPLLDA